MIIKSDKIYSEEKIIDGYLEINDGKITNILTTYSGQIDHDYTGYNVIPGFIDVHIHGADGADIMDGTLEAIEKIAKYLPNEGTTSFLATTMTQSPENINKALINIKSYTNNENGILDGRAEVLGVHLEGPFISAKRKGAQSEKYIAAPNIEMMKKYQAMSGSNIKVVTYAVEEGESSFTDYLKEENISGSVGHSDATYEQVKDAHRRGLKSITHCYNGMTGFHHREPGIAFSALAIDDIYVELIADGVHINKDVLKYTVENKNLDYVLLITDSLRGKGLEDGIYDLGGQLVKIENNVARLVEGNSLAGSTLHMNEAVKLIKNITSFDMYDIIKISSTNKAKYLNIFDRKGSIKIGKDADLVIVDSEFNIIDTFCRGIK